MWLVLIPGAALSGCLAAHVLLSRALPGISRPAAVWWSFLLGLVLLIAGAVALDPAGVRAVPTRLIAWAMTYVCLAYCYIFGFFNVGESARRIRLLIELRNAGPRGLTYDEILSAYNARMIIDARLDRLVAGCQLIERDGRYTVGRAELLFVTRVLNVWKRIAFGAAPEADRQLSWSKR